MTLPVHSRLGPYEIVGLVGAGGMGEVYKARDTRLDRTVAIKVLPESLALDATFRARFDREARAISALNNPHICTLHDVGQEGNTAYLVMEYVAGTPLVGPLAPPQAIPLAMQICDALDAAHRAGIIHRDLKPSNILRTKSGVKLLDFGLATRAVPVQADAIDATISASLTGAHTVLGTPQYMAPEQIEGREADARTDIFALGCVLYELITGQRAYTGDSPSRVMAAILATEPRPMRDLQPIAPPSLEWIVARCLKKDPDERWQTVRDLRAALELVAQAAVAVIPRTRSRLRPMAALLALVGLIVGAGGAVVYFRAKGAPAGEVIGARRADLQIREPLALNVQGPAVAISPDGKVFAYLTGRNPQARLFVRRLDDVAGTVKYIADGAYGPFFSPDGKWIAYGSTADGKLMKAQVSGDSAPQPVADVIVLRGGVWLPDDTIVFSANTGTALLRVPASGGKPTPATTLNRQRDDKTHRFPDALPDGRHIIFTVANHEVASYEDGSIVMASLDGGEDKVLVEHAMFGRYVPTGHLLFSRGTSIYAVPFDAVRGEVTGPPSAVLAGVMTHPTYAYADFAVSRNGVMVYGPGGRSGDLRRLVWADRRGNTQPAYSETMPFNSARLSPDGRRLLIEIGAANNALSIVDLERNVRTRLTFHGDAYFGRWSPDGARIAYMSGEDIHLVATDGSGRDDVLVDAGGKGALVPTGWSPDGRILVYEEDQPNRPIEIRLLDVNTRKSSDYSTSSFSERGAQFSPDGRWMAYLSNESGRYEVYLRPFGRPGGRWQISRDGTDQFAWNPKGGEILYRSGNGMFSVAVRLTDPPAIGAAVHLFDSPSISTALGIFGFGLSTDGARFLLQEPVPEPAVHTLAFVSDWFSALRK